MMTYPDINPNSTWLVTTQHVRRVEPCCSTSSTQPKCRHVYVSCRDVTWRVKWNLGY